MLSSESGLVGRCHPPLYTQGTGLSAVSTRETPLTCSEHAIATIYLFKATLVLEYRWNEVHYGTYAVHRRECFVQDTGAQGPRLGSVGVAVCLQMAKTQTVIIVTLRDKERVCDAGQAIWCARSTRSRRNHLNINRLPRLHETTANLEATVHIVLPFLL